MEWKVLHAHGWSVSRLAREFGLSRTTIRRELTVRHRAAILRAARPRRSPTQQAHVERRLAMCPTLRGTVLYHELGREFGYLGSYPAFIRHLRTLRPRAASEPVVRFETAPGVQVQADWAHLGVWPLEDGMAELFGLVAILGCSRAPAVRLAADHMRSTTLERLVRCLDDLGGVP
jgi:transposase